MEESAGWLFPQLLHDKLYINNRFGPRKSRKLPIVGKSLIRKASLKAIIRVRKASGLGRRCRFGETQLIYGEFWRRRKIGNRAPDRAQRAPSIGHRRRYGESRPIYGEFPAPPKDRKPGAGSGAKGAFDRTSPPIRRIPTDLRRIPGAAERSQTRRRIGRKGRLRSDIAANTENPDRFTENSRRRRKIGNQAPDRAQRAPSIGHRRRYGESRPIYGEFPAPPKDRKPGAGSGAKGAFDRTSPPIRRMPDEAELFSMPYP